MSSFAAGSVTSAEDPPPKELRPEGSVFERTELSLVGGFVLGSFAGAAGSIAAEDSAVGTS